MADQIQLSGTPRVSLITSTLYIIDYVLTVQQATSTYCPPQPPGEFDCR